MWSSSNDYGLNSTGERPLGNYTAIQRQVALFYKLAQQMAQDGQVFAQVDPQEELFKLGQGDADTAMLYGLKPYMVMQPLGTPTSLAKLEVQKIGGAMQPQFLRSLLRKICGGSVMDNQEQFQQLPTGYGAPGDTGVILPSRKNPYEAIQQQVTTPESNPYIPKQAPQFPSMTDFIVNRAKADNVDPSQLTDDDIKKYGKQYAAYDKDALTDPIKTGPLARHLGENYKGTRENFELHHAAHAGQALDELEQNLPAFKDYLKTLAPKDAQGQPIQAPTTNSYPGTATPAGGYDLIDNPVTRGLAQGGNVLTSGIGYIGNKLGVSGLGTNPLTGEAYAKETSQLQAPENAGLGARLTQGAASFVGPAAAATAAALGGGILAGGLTYGIPNAASTAAEREAAGNPLSTPQLTKLAAAETLQGMLPMGGKGLSVLKNALTGGTIGIFGDVVDKAILGEQPSAEDLEASGLTGAALSVLFHLPPAAKKTLRAAINALRGKMPPVVSEPKSGGGPTPPPGGGPTPSVTSPRGGFTNSKGEYVPPQNAAIPVQGALTPLSPKVEETLNNAVGDIHAAAEDGDISPERYRQVLDTHLPQVPEVDRPAFVQEFNNTWADVHGLTPEEVASANAPQNEPMQTPPVAEQAAVPENKTTAAGTAIPPVGSFEQWRNKNFSKGTSGHWEDANGNAFTSEKLQEMYAKSAETAPKAAPEKAPTAPETAAELPKGAVASAKGSVASMLAEPVRAPILKSGKSVGSTELKFTSDIDKLGYLHANADVETKLKTAEQLKAHGVRDPDAFATQVQAQVKALTKSNALKSTPAITKIGPIVPHVMQGIPIPKRGARSPKETTVPKV